MNAAKTIRIAVALQLIVRTSDSPPGGEKDVPLYAGRTADGSLVAFGLFLEDGDLGFFFFFPEVKTEEKRRAQRQRRQQ